MGEVYKDKLVKEREKKDKEKKDKEKIILEKKKKLQKIKSNALQKLIEKEKRLEKINDDEFEQLVKEIIPLNFTTSTEVSSYIRNNKLGNKYKNISGIVTMEQEGRQWDFKGGFPSNIYAKLCSELGLKNKGSHARVVDFKSFKELN